MLVVDELLHFLLLCFPLLHEAFVLFCGWLEVVESSFLIQFLLVCPLLPQVCVSGLLVKLSLLGIEHDLSGRFPELCDVGESAQVDNPKTPWVLAYVNRK